MSSCKVRFCEGRNEIHPMIKWTSAYRMARKKYWEFFAIDRVRFYHRIQETAEIINPVLDCNHRLRIYIERFK
jgi:Phosphatase-1 catalytic subunit binding region